LRPPSKRPVPKVPVEYQDYSSEAEEWSDLTADNRIAELAEMDNTKLSELLNEIIDADFDIEMTGYTEDDLNELLENIIDEIDMDIEVVEDDFEVELPEEPKANYGDIYRLGNHRLMCGDSTNADDVYTLMDGEKCNLLITDPPYNVNYEGTAGKIQNDNMNDESFRLFLSDAIKCADNVMNPGAAFYIWHADSEGYNFRGACKDNGWKVRQCLIWRKNTFVLGRQDYQWQHEPCLYGWKEGASHFWNSDRSQTTVLEFDKPSRNEEHPTMKPVDLISYQIKNSTKQGCVVLDLFGGSGTTLIACEQLKRNCYMMELDPRYVDVIIDRWEKLTGEKAVLLSVPDGRERAVRR
jgi:site-specific DNA-methyltransferase (adenine-specific)